jgi:hypothetical protein
MQGLVFSQKAKPMESLFPQTLPPSLFLSHPRDGKVILKLKRLRWKAIVSTRQFPYHPYLGVHPSYEIDGPMMTSSQPAEPVMNVSRLA